MSQAGNDKRALGVLGVPFCGGQPKAGAECGPKAVRDTGLIKMLQDLDWSVNDRGDLGIEPVSDDPPSGHVKNPRFVGATCKKLSDTVGSIVKSGERGVVIGGDHSIAIGSIHGHMHARDNVCVVWVDAHADLNPPPASTSGNIHGMPLAFLVHEIQEYVPKLPGFYWVKPCLHTKDLVYIALRDVDSAERLLIETHNIAFYSMQEVVKYGIQQVVERALADVNPKLDRPIHLSFDIDALDPDYAPSTGTRVPGGLDLREGKYIAEELANTGQLMMVDLVEVNPKLGSDEDAELTAVSASHIIASCFGKKTQGNVPQGYKIPKAK